MYVHMLCIFRYQWTRAVVVKLFIEHVCTSGKEEMDIRRCMPLWQVSTIKYSQSWLYGHLKVVITCQPVFTLLTRFMCYLWIGARTAYPSGAPELTTVF